MVFPNRALVSTLDFAVQHNWDFRFMSPSVDEDIFGDRWFPAHSLDLDLYKLSLYSVNSNMTPFFTPLRNEVGNLDITVMFYDLADSRIEDFMRTWVSTISPRTQYGAVSHISRLVDSTRLVEVKRLLPNKTSIYRPISKKEWTEQLLIIPEGTLKFLGTSTTGLLNYSQSFKICGGSVL